MLSKVRRPVAGDLSLMWRSWTAAGVFLNSTQLKFIENGSRMAKRIQNTVHKNKSND